MVGARPRPICDPSLRRLAAGVYALAGLDRALAASVDPRLLAIGDDEDAASAFDDIGGKARSHDYLAVAVISAVGGRRASARTLTCGSRTTAR